MSMNGSVLVVDDEAVVHRSTRHALEERGFAVWSAFGLRQGFAVLERGEVAPDVILTSLRMCEGSGLEILAAVRARHSSTPTIVMVERTMLGAAIAAMRAGAYDFVIKPFDYPQVLVSAVERAAERRNLIEQNRRLAPRLALAERFQELIGTTRGLRAVAALIDTVASTPSTVLVRGENGTGKELVGRAIHRSGDRSAQPFFAIDCRAASEAALERELFGHDALDGALASRHGLFEQASRGTLFLRHVNALPLGVQSRVLGALQDREVKRSGSGQAQAVNPRVVASTSVNLAAEVTSGRFRQELFFHLNVVPIDVPPLRERMEDVPLLVHHMVQKHAARHGRLPPRVDPAALAHLCEHEWPGNVKELEDVVERAVLVARDAITEQELPISVRRVPLAHLASSTEGALMPFAAARERFERGYLHQLMIATEGSLGDAARIAGMDRSNLRRLLRRLSVPVLARSRETG